MQNDIMTALLLDPFLTYAEAEKEFGAISSPVRGMGATAATAAAPSHTPEAARRPARIKVPGVPAIHHPPATAG